MRIIVCDVKDTVSICTVKHERERVREFGNKEMWDKDLICTYNRTDVGTPFGERLFRSKFART